jgi:hypothetical protein
MDVISSAIPKRDLLEVLNNMAVSDQGLVGQTEKVMDSRDNPTPSSLF